MEQNTNTSLFGLSIDQTGRSHLIDAAKWARFLAIVGFVFITLFAILAIFFGSYFATMMSSGTGDFQDVEIDREAATAVGIGMIIYYLIVFTLVFLAYMFLYRFAVNMRKALDTNDQNTLNRSFMYLKVLYRYWGILTIIGLAIFCVFFLIAVLAGSMAPR